MRIIVREKFSRRGEAMWQEFDGPKLVEFSSNAPPVAWITLDDDLLRVTLDAPFETEVLGGSVWVRKVADLG